MLGQIPHKERIKRSNYQYYTDEREESYHMREGVRKKKEIMIKE